MERVSTSQGTGRFAPAERPAFLPVVSGSPAMPVTFGARDQEWPPVRQL